MDNGVHAPMISGKKGTKMAKMARLSKQHVLMIPLKTEEVEVEEWGGTVLVSEIPVVQRNALFRKYIGPDGKPIPSMSLYLDMFVAGCIDPKFSEAEASQLSHRPVEEVAKVIMRLNGLGSEAADEARGNS